MTASSLLYVTQVAPYRDGPAGVHGVLDQSATAMSELAETAGLGFTRVDDVRDLKTSTLDSAAVLALFTIGETPWSIDQRSTILTRLRAGKLAVLAIHSSTDACYEWDEYPLVVGARFDGHPWTQACHLDVTDPTHPAVAHLGSTWYWHDEVYKFKNVREDATVLLTARPHELAQEPRSARAPDPLPTLPLSWCFTEGKGRVFSTSLGHFPHAWESQDYLRHLAGGLEWLTSCGDGV